jgi:hypothetical protein
MMFAILIFEREPLQWSEVGSAILTWARNAGGFAAFALLIWGLVRFSRRRPDEATEWTLSNRLFAAAYAGCVIAYGLFFVLLFTQGTLLEQVRTSYGKTFESWKLTEAEGTCLTAGGICALIAVLIPVIAGLSRVRGRRIWAIAKLSIKETIRQRVLWVFAFMVLVFLFASWFIDTDKPEYQLSTYISVVDFVLTRLLLLAASLLAAFGIPSDVRSQTIHTVVTKPVERFEIVLGRFLGYSLLMSAVLFVATGLGLVYLFRSINEEARQETYKARVPIYGQEMRLEPPGEGVNVGREWTHRIHISGPRHKERTTPQYSVWSFEQVPDRLAERPEGVVCEFSFDIYRTHKGVQGEGIFCQFLVVTSQIKLVKDANEELVPERETLETINRRTAELTREFRNKLAPGARAGTQLSPELSRKINLAVSNQIAEEFGYFKPPPVQATDYHTQGILLPAGIFRNLQQPRSTEVSEDADAAGTRDPLRIFVNVTSKSPAQLIGVAKKDLYLLDLERSFAGNYFKAAFGLWYRLLLMIGLAVAISTYLSGIITWICAMFLFVLGNFKDDIMQLAQGLSEGGGPSISAIRVLTRKTTAAELEQTTLHQVASVFDEAYQFVLGLITKLLPDVNRFDLSPYLSNGFDISGDVLFLDTFLPLLGYLVPCLVFAYYLMQYREVANPA